MTAEEVFCDLAEKYFTNKTFVEELRKEIGESHFLYNEKIYAVAKCDSNDDVYVCGRENEKDAYYIFHLTWQSSNEKGFARYKKIVGINAVKEYIESSYVSEYL